MMSGERLVNLLRKSFEGLRAEHAPVVSAAAACLRPSSPRYDVTSTRQADVFGQVFEAPLFRSGQAGGARYVTGDKEIRSIPAHRHGCEIPSRL